MCSHIFRYNPFKYATSNVQFPERTRILVLAMFSFDPNVEIPKFFKGVTQFHTAAVNQVKMGKNRSYE